MNSKSELKRLAMQNPLEMAERVYRLEQKLAIAMDVLKFYADRGNWDDDKFNPTCWDDGDIDLGKKAKKALTEIEAVGK